MNQEDITRDGLPMPKRLYAIVTVSLGVVLAVMDTTIVNVALPSMAQTFSQTEANTIWIVNAYQLAIVMLLLAMSSIGEIYSYRKTYLVGISIFTLSSLACGLAPNEQILIYSRLLQGFGAAAMMAINMTLLRLSYPKKYFGKGIGLNATIVAIATVVAPSVAALILSTMTWHWLFLINVPLGIAGFVIGCYNLPQNTVKLSSRKFPLKDIILNAMFFGCFILTIEGISHDFNISTIVFLACTAAVIGTIYLRKELKEQYPLLPLDLLKIPIFSLSVLTSIASFTAQMMAMVSLPFFLQQTLSYSASETGLLFTSWPIAITITAPIAGSLIGKVHSGTLGGIGLGVMAFGLLMLALLPDNPSTVDIIWRLMLCGGGFGLFQSPNNNVLITSAPTSRSGSASGMLAMARLIGQTTGATIVALLFHIFSKDAPTLALWTGTFIALLASTISLSRLMLKQ